MSSDRALQQSIETQFLRHPHTSGYSLTVEVVNGVATLRGIVPNARVKVLAQELAEATEGCRDVFNEIVIEPAGGVTDHQMSDEIRSLLDEHPGITKAAITVQVRSGIVTLSGAVGTPIEYSLAEDVARSARGVREVQNLLLIDRSAQDDNESLQLEIESALAAIPELRQEDLKVAVGGDVVVLSGQVHDASHKQLAEEVVQGVRPWRVRNEIDILT